MKQSMKWVSLVVVAALLPAGFALASEDLDQEAVAAEATKDRPEWSATLKEKYNLTDEQMAQLSSSGISRPQTAMAAEIAKQSGRSLDEVLKMRTEQKMGWGKIAKELGVEPGAIGRAVADMRHSIHAERKEAHAHRHEVRAERKAEREERIAERKERRGKGLKGE